MSQTILIVDDNAVERRLVESVARKLGYSPLLAEDGARALEIMEGSAPGHVRAVLLDLMMPGIDGIEVMRCMRKSGKDVPVIVQTARGSIETAVMAMRAGAFDFVVKPVSPERLASALSAAVKVEAFGAGRTQEAPGSFSFGDIVTRSPAMERVLTLARKAAGSNIPILIEGETGVGKELIARAIRAAGSRRDNPFVIVNCGAIPENLVESILFGHAKGAFTGATERQIGKFLEADGGTLFLDEVGELSLDIQVKLLRAVQDGEIDPLGRRGTVKVDVRLISATNRDLLSEVRAGRFREDLFYRLGVFPVTVPPLRARWQDIPLLVHHFIDRFGPERKDRPVTGISADAMKILTAYDWPGNIRQLSNAVFRAVLLAEHDQLGEEEFSQISAQIPTLVGATGSFLSTTSLDHPGLDHPGLDHPGLYHPGSDHPGNEKQMRDGTASHAVAEKFEQLSLVGQDGHARTFAEIEADVIRHAMQFYQGQISEVARRLGIGRSTLYRKLKELGIVCPDEPTDEI